MTNLSTRDPRAVVPPMGNIEAYIKAVHEIPLLEDEEELELGRRVRDNGDVEAAGRLVLSHLRVVTSVSRQYDGYGLPREDIIQEGNIGLMKAVKNFDPDRGARLVTYAMFWIKAEIHEHIMRNWRVVRIATTKAQRKIFFNLRRLTQKMRAGGATKRLSLSEAEEIGLALDVDASDVIEMEGRMYGSDLSMSGMDRDDDSDEYTPLHWLKSEHGDPLEELERAREEDVVSVKIPKAIESLSPREKMIINRRWTSGQSEKTLRELGEEIGVSAERVRQIEVSAMKKLRLALEVA